MGPKPRIYWCPAFQVWWCGTPETWERSGDTPKEAHNKWLTTKHIVPNRESE